VQVLQEEGGEQLCLAVLALEEQMGARQGTWVSSLPPMCSLLMNTRGTVVPPVICFSAA
jgi:hypothetical protein